MRRFAETLEGRVVLPGTDDYEAARRVYNGLIDKRPDVIAFCDGVEDVRRTVLFAREHDQLLAIRGSGHNVAGLGTIEGNILAVLTEMRGVRVDPTSRLARVGAGATWGHVDRECQAFGLATTGGIVHDTGVAGLTLGGGLGWLMGVAGLTCDNLTAVDIVLADGTVVCADDDSDPDLMWALRGGGGNFGVVTSFEYRLHEVGEVQAGSLRFPLSNAVAALNVYASFAEECPDAITVSPSLMTNESLGPHVSLDVCSLLGAAETDARTAAFNALSGLAASSVRPMTYCDWQKSMRDPYRRGRRSYWKSLSMASLSRGVIEALVAGLDTAPSPHALITVDHVHGLAQRVSAGATAYGERLPFVVLINANWDDPKADRANVDWARELFSAIVEISDSTTAYINYLDSDDSDRLASAYGTNWERLRRIKTTCDPSNFFRVNQNILPITAAETRRGAVS